jgi:CheY-like chemotaxis protein
MAVAGKICRAMTRPVRKTAPAPTAGARHVARRVLVVDDNADFLAMLCETLRVLGHDVRSATDGPTGLALAKAWRPDVALLDVYLPSRTGFELARELRAVFPRSTLRLVMMSGVDLDEDALEGAGRVGFDECIGKLLSPAEVDRVVCTPPEPSVGH